MSEAALPDPVESFIEALVERVRDSIAAEPMPRRYLSRQALAEHLGVQERTIRTWREKGLPGHRVGKEVMYELDAVSKWIAGHP